MKKTKVNSIKLGDTLYINLDYDSDVNTIILALNRKYTIEIKNGGVPKLRQYAALDDISSLAPFTKTVSPFSLLAYLQNPCYESRPSLAMLQTVGLDEKSLNVLRAAVRRRPNSIKGSFRNKKTFRSKRNRTKFIVSRNGLDSGNK
ncbi:MAG: hypothetical protein IJ558_08710 [Treponema sp.]|nr:hypothetical protein [Treponema sp.]